MTYFEVLLPFIYFLDTFNKIKGHNMFALMFDPKFKTIKLVTMYLGCEIVTIVVVKYDEFFLLLLSMEVNKLLMPNKVEMAFGLDSQIDCKGPFHTTTTTINTHKNIVSRELVGT
jgi:hypothetical protein